MTGLLCKILEVNMSKIGKSCSMGGNFHLKPIPQEFLKKVLEHRNKVQVKNLWMQNIGVEKGVNQLRDKEIDSNDKKSEQSEVCIVAFKILFPDIGNLVQIKGMPEMTLDEKIEKEQAFRKLVLEKFDIREVVTDSNCGLRAVISCLNPELDRNSEDITTVILKGDLVDYVMKHPDIIEGGNEPEILKRYCSEMSKCDAHVGLNELRIMSEMLESPIHIYRYEDARLDDQNKVCAGKKSIFGSQYTMKKPISIYYDPLNEVYFPLYLKKHSKFGILKRN
jgi:hypothetical protein